MCTDFFDRSVWNLWLIHVGKKHVSHKFFVEIETLDTRCKTCLRTLRPFSRKLSARPHVKFHPGVLWSIKLSWIESGILFSLVSWLQICLQIVFSPEFRSTEAGTQIFAKLFPGAQGGSKRELLVK